MPKNIELGLINDRTGLVVDEALRDAGAFDPEVVWSATGTGQVWAEGDKLYARISDSADEEAIRAIADAATAAPVKEIVFTEFEEAMMIAQGIDKNVIKASIEAAREAEKIKDK